MQIRIARNIPDWPPSDAALAGPNSEDHNRVWKEIKQSCKYAEMHLASAGFFIDRGNGVNYKV